ncbi:hypothetical protein G5B38_00995 [Pseudohalocynthiibacter aestuariivivens]|nr:hypothetical protein G5B38_00995 [Pseudohalocynthiibacter aestuariivivens]
MCQLFSPPSPKDTSKRTSTNCCPGITSDPCDQRTAYQRPTSFDHRNGSQLGDAVHQVELLDGSNLRRICDVDNLWVNSVHHQAVDILGSGLHATALANDGIIEAFEDREYPFLMGIQWHPEHLPQDRRQGRIFDAFITASCDGAIPR